MDDRYLTSFEALRAGLLVNDKEAREATLRILESAHNSSRSQVVVFVAELPSHIRDEVLELWFAGPWWSQRAAWWVCGYLERTHDDTLQDTLRRFRLFDRLVGAEDYAVCVQALAWLHSRASAGRVPEVSVSSPLVVKIITWLHVDDPALSIGALQTLVSLRVPIHEPTAQAVVRRGVDAGIRAADFLGIKFGVETSGTRLADEIIRNGPWSVRAVDALCKHVMNEALSKLSEASRWRFINDDTRIHIATVLASHGDAAAWNLLVNFSGQKDLRKRGMGFSARIKALEARGSDKAHADLWKEVLKQPEDVRAWVISCLNPSLPIHRYWLEEARQFGTNEERSAVDDAYRAAFSIDG